MVKCHSNRLSSRGAASKSGLGPASDIYETRGQDGLEGGTGRVRRSPRRRRTSLASRRMRFTAGLLVLADMLLILSSALSFLPGCPTATATYYSAYGDIRGTGLNSVFLRYEQKQARIPLWKTSASMMWQSLEAALKVLLPSAPPPPSPPSTFDLFGLLNPPPPPPAPARGSPYLVAYVVLVLLSHCWEQCARSGPACEVRGVARVRSDRRLRYVLHFDRLQICAGARGVVSSSRACQIRCGLRSVQSTRRSTRGRRNMARRRTTLAS